MNIISIALAIIIPMSLVPVTDINGDTMVVQTSCTIITDASTGDTFSNIIREEASTELFMNTCFQQSERDAARAYWESVN